MGTWNAEINGNDSFLDIYQVFFDLYNQGHNPTSASKQIQDDYAEMFEDYEDRNNSFFGLALAQWETKSLSSEIYKKVKEIIEYGDDIKLWKELGADEKTLKQREIFLDRFLVQISTEREKPKRRIKPKFEFDMINIVDISAPDSLKTLRINEEYSNKKYIHTSGIMSWKDGGGSVLYFTGQGKNISAKWLSSQVLEITHDKNINFIKKDNSAYYCGDDVKVIYIEQ